MAVPSSGEISLGKIRQELQTANYAAGPYTSAATGLDPAENGTYATINTCSPSYPLSANPANMSEWYGYDHDAPCYNSYYAMDDGGASTSQNMLYSNSAPYGSTTSTSRPSPLAQLTINFWIRRDTDDSSQGYIFGLYDPTLADRLTINWYSINIGGVDYSMINLAYNDSGGGYFYSVFVLNDTNNAAITGVLGNTYWSKSNQGNTNAFEYTMVTAVVDYSGWAGNDFVKWYWNGEQVQVPWDGGINPNADGLSATYGDSIIDPDWSSATLYLGGSFPSELSAGSLLDGFAIYTSTAVSATDVTNVLWGTILGGTNTVASLADHQSVASSDLLYYNFENEGLLGEDTGGYYGQDLDDFNSPLQTTHHA